MGYKQEQRSCYKYARPIQGTGLSKSSSTFAILLNGKPGMWFRRRMLRQGGPLSPYLFILVVDVLQRMIIQASNVGLLSHPLDNNLPCPVLQYADDLLMILPTVAEQLHHLKLLPNQFIEAIGLSINFHKSTFASIHVDPDLSITLAAILRCPMVSFPQLYLVFPSRPPS